MKNYRINLLLSFVLILASVSFAYSAEKPLSVVVSILPQVEFVKSIGKERVNVSVMIPKGANPHSYEPTPRQLKNLSDADIYLKVGTRVEFELSWLPKLTKLNKSMLIVDMSEGVDLIQSKVNDHHDEAEIKEMPRSYAVDPHYWLSPARMIRAIENIYNGLASLDKNGRAFYEKNMINYKAQLKGATAKIVLLLSNIKNRKFLVFHPSFGYFADQFGLVQIPVEVEGKEPSAKQMIELVTLAKNERIETIFVSPEFSPRSAQVIASQTGGNIKAIDPLAEDYRDNLLTIAEAISQSAQ